MTTPQLPAENWAPRFFTLWIGQAISLLGSQLVQFAIIWYLTLETNSATALAIASLMGLLPQVIFSFHTVGASHQGRFNSFTSAGRVALILKSIHSSTPLQQPRCASWWSFC